MKFDTAVHIAAPKALAYRVLADVGDYAEWLPGCEAVEARQLDADAVEAEIVLRRPRRVRLRLRFGLQPEERVSFRMLDGGGLREFSGSWRLSRMPDGGSLVRGAVDVQPARGVPAFLLRGPVRSWLEDSARALREHVTEKFETSVESTRRGAATRRGRRLLYVGQLEDGTRRVWVSRELRHGPP